MFIKNTTAEVILQMLIHFCMHFICQVLKKLSEHEVTGQVFKYLLLDLTIINATKQVMSVNLAFSYDSIKDEMKTSCTWKTLGKS